MTKKQASTLMGLLVALILTQILCTTLILLRLERAERVRGYGGYSARNTAVLMQGPKASVPAAQTFKEAAPSPQQEGQQFMVILPEHPEPSAPAEESKDTRPFEDVKPDHWAYSAVTDDQARSQRPSQKVDDEVASQIRKYSFAVAEEERFRDTKTR